MDAFRSIAVIIPSLEPDEKLIMLLGRLRSAGFEHLIVINDGSDASYDHYFDEARDRYGCAVLKHAVNLGKGRALKNAINHVLNELPDCAGVVTADSDGQHTTEDIVACAQAVIENPDCLVLGCRDFSSENVPFRSRQGNLITRRMVRYLCGLDVSDTQTGLRAMSRDLMRIFVKTRGERFEYEMNVLVDTRKYSIGIKEIPIETVYDKENHSSHFDTVRDAARVYSAFNKYFLVALISGVADILIFALCFHLVSGVMPVWGGVLVATSVARIVSSFISYMINKKGLFKGPGVPGGAAARYYSFSLIQMLLSAVLVALLYDLLGGAMSIVVAKLIVDCVLVLISLSARRAWTFGRRARRVNVNIEQSAKM